MGSNFNYCSITTRTHFVATANSIVLEDFNQLVAQEGYNGTLPVFFNNEVVINLDKAEAIRATVAGIDRSKSIDSCFGVTNIGSGLKEILLVEFKFRFTDFKFLKKVDMEEKVAGSLFLLGTSVPICNKYIFIFSSSLKQQAKRRLFAMNPKIPIEYEAMDLLELIALAI